MRYWEFLIQQEGDQTWLPLETRQVEILEGRYRMAAHTSYGDTSVEVRVSQLLLDEIPPRRRVRKRKAMTNDSGLLAIFPFIQLSPGCWEIDCNSPDVIDDFLGDGWHYSVQLQVTPREEDSEDNWDPDWSATPIELGRLQSSESPSLQTDSSTVSLNENVQANEVRLQLKQQAYVTQLGQQLTLTGYLSQVSGEPIDSQLGGQLWVQLRDPQTATSLQETTFTTPNHSLPWPLSVTITLPDQLSTQVILGSISWLNQHGAVLTSASFTVTIGLAQMLDAIANQPNLDFEEEISIFPGSTEAFVPSPEKAETLLISDTPIISKEIVPSAGLTLPPQIKPLGMGDSEHQPELPDFPASNPKPERTNERRTATSAVEESPDAIDKTAKDTVDDAFTAADTDEIVLPDIAAPDIAVPDIAVPDIAVPDRINEPQQDPDGQSPFAEPEPRVFDSGTDDNERELDLAIAELENELSPELTSEIPAVQNAAESSSYMDYSLYEDQYRVSHLEEPEDTSIADDTWWDGASSDLGREIDANIINANINNEFQKLQLQERFWQKLNLLTQDGYRQAIEVKKALEIDDVLLNENQQSNQFNNDVDQQSNEFVVYEPSIRSQSSTRSEWSTNKAVDKTGPVQVLTPSLDVPEQELIAGEWIAIKVRVPAGRYQPYVKVWMNDLQTRTLIDAPRLLMQFTPNDYNELETLMRVRVPTGCLELQFAAIAVDMTTLQESRKVVQNRRVMPPDESLSIFDDWV